MAVHLIFIDEKVEIIYSYLSFIYLLHNQKFRFYFHVINIGR